MLRSGVVPDTRVDGQHRHRLDPLLVAFVADLYAKRRALGHIDEREEPKS